MCLKDAEDGGEFLVFQLDFTAVTNAPFLKRSILHDGVLVKILYDYLDQSDFYIAHSDPGNRSLMNVTFTCPNKDLDAKFVKESVAAGMTNLKGHRSVGGIRASIYNAMEKEGVETLVAFMKKFEEENR